MKKALILFLLLGTAFSASAMGHPHNVFSTHRKAKQQPVKTSICRSSAKQVVRQSLTTYAQAALPSVGSFVSDMIRRKMQ